MLVNADRFSVLLHTLGLSQGLFKPTPSLLASSAYTSSAANGTNVSPQAYNSSVFNVSSNFHSPADIPNVANDIQTLDQQGKACHVDSYDAPAVDLQPFFPFDETKANVFRYRQQQSVNLGSWYFCIISVGTYTEQRPLGSYKKVGWYLHYILVLLDHRSRSLM